MELKTILVTGGTGKVGMQLVEHFLKEQYHVIITSRSQQKIDEISQRFDQEGFSNTFDCIHIDLEKEDAVQHMMQWFEERGCWPNILVNNARNINYTTIENGYMKRSNWIGELTLDVVVPYELTMAFADHPNSKLENVINIASMYGVVAPNPHLYENPKTESPINYGVAKAALLHLTKELAIRLAADDIRVNAISYGGIVGRVTDAFKQRYRQLCPIGRMLEEKEVVGAVHFLASQHSTGMTGQNLVVDGGWSVW